LIIKSKQISFACNFQYFLKLIRFASYLFTNLEFSSFFAHPLRNSGDYMMLGVIDRTYSRNFHVKFGMSCLEYL